MDGSRDPADLCFPGTMPFCAFQGIHRRCVKIGLTLKILSTERANIPLIGSGEEQK